MVVLTQDFPSHVLRRNHQQGIPHRVIYLDTETAPRTEGAYQVQYMQLAWTCACRYGPDGRRLRESWKEWTSGEALCAWLDKVALAGTSVHVFAHNAFFDLQACGFFKHMAKAGWILQFYYDKGLTYILVLGQGGRTLRVISTTNFYECALKELGALVGLEKGAVDFTLASPEQLSAYCRRDVEILQAGMERYFGFLLEHDLGRFRMSRASQAMAAFRHRFMGQKIYLHADEQVRRLEREAYFGGRVECFQLGEIKDGPFLSLDVNSMYPHIMKRQAVPIRLVDYQENWSLKKLTEALQTFAVVARVELHTEQPLYPMRRGHKVIYPIGRFEATLCTPALKEAVKRGHVTAVWEAAVYQKGWLFEGFVDFFYELKRRYQREGRKVEEYLVKKLLNSLYGKWAQRRPVVEDEIVLDYSGYWREEVLDLVTGKLEIEYKLLNRWVRLFGEEDDERAFVAISAHITEGARMYLWSLLERFESGQVLYCDTDSLWIRERDRARVADLISADRLGGLKVAGQYHTLKILGPKAYWADGRRTVKGVPAAAVETGPLTFSYTSFLHQTTHMREGQVEGVLTQQTLKRLWGRYDKGEVSASGLVTPFRL